MLFFNEKGLNMWMIAPNEMLHIRSMSVLMEENMRCKIHAFAAKTMQTGAANDGKPVIFGSDTA